MWGIVLPLRLHLTPHSDPEAKGSFSYLQKYKYREERPTQFRHATIDWRGQTCLTRYLHPADWSSGVEFCADIEIGNERCWWRIWIYPAALELTARRVISVFQVLHRKNLTPQSLITAYISTPHSFPVTLTPSLRAILNHYCSPHSHFWRQNGPN